MKRLLWFVFFLVASAPAVSQAQEQGKPGAFDFYLLNIVPASEFCFIKDVGSTCQPPKDGFVLHGLWPQRNNGTYPVFCGKGTGPQHPERNLDITPDGGLLDHEWLKHGTCTTLHPDRFFMQARKAYRALRVPPEFAHVERELQLKPIEVLDLFAKQNPAYPRSSLILWCSEHRLASVSTCLSKELKPIACQGLKTCTDDFIVLMPPPTRVN